MSDRHPLWQLLDRLQMDIRSMDAKLVEIRSLISQLQLAPPTRHLCVDCGAVHRHSQALAEHRYRCHDGPVPAHYLAAELAAGFDVEPRVSSPTGEERATEPDIPLPATTPEEAA